MSDVLNMRNNFIVINYYLQGEVYEQWKTKQMQGHIVLASGQTGPNLKGGGGLTPTPQPLVYSNYHYGAGPWHGGGEMA